MDVEAKINGIFEDHAELGKLGASNVPYVDAHVRAARDQPDRSLTSREEYMQKHFASIVGSLIYLSITCRPDIAYAVNQMAKGMHAPKLWHIAMMNQCLK